MFVNVEGQRSRFTVQCHCDRHWANPPGELSWMVVQVSLSLSLSLSLVMQGDFVFSTCTFSYETSGMKVMKLCRVVYAKLTSAFPDSSSSQQ